MVLAEAERHTLLERLGIEHVPLTRARRRLFFGWAAFGRGGVRVVCRGWVQGLARTGGLTLRCGCGYDGVVLAFP
jgi:hypothetical protein